MSKVSIVRRIGSGVASVFGKSGVVAINTRKFGASARAIMKKYGSRTAIRAGVNAVAKTNIGKVVRSAFRGAYRSVMEAVKKNPAVLVRNGKYSLISQRGRVLFKSISNKLPSFITSSPAKKVAAFAKMLGGYIIIDAIAEEVLDFFEGVMEDEGGEKLAELQAVWNQAALDILREKDVAAYDQLNAMLEAANDDDEAAEILSDWFESNADLADEVYYEAAVELGIAKQLLFLVMDSSNAVEVNELAKAVGATSEDVVADAEEVDEEAVARAATSPVLMRALANLNADDLQLPDIDFGEDEVVREWEFKARRFFSSCGGVEQAAALRDAVAMSPKDFMRLVALAYGPEYARELAERS